MQGSEGRRATRRGSVASRIVLVVLLASLPAFALLLSMGLRQRDASVEGARRDVISLARAAALKNRQVLEDGRRLLLVLSGVPEVREGAAAASLFARLVGDRRTLANVGYARADGTVTASAVPMDGPVNIADRAYFRRAMESGELSAGDYQVGRITGRPSLNLGLPVRDASGAAAGVLFAALDLRALDSVPLELAAPPGSVLLVLDARGAVLLRHPEASAVPGEIHPVPEIARAAAAGTQNEFRAPGSDGVVRMFAAAPLAVGGRHGATVMVGVPESAVFGPVDRALALHLALLAGVAGLTAIGAGVLGRWLVGRHARRLVEASRRLAGGDLAARMGTGSGPGELGRIAEAFDEMAASLERRTGELEESRAAADRARESYRRLVEDMPACFYEETRRGAEREVFVSPRTEAAFRFTAEEWRRDPAAWTRSVHPEDREAVLRGYEEALARGGPYCFEYRLLGDGDRPRWLRDRGVVLAANGGRTARGFAVDITEQRSALEQLQQAQKMEAMGRLAAGVAHDFNNMLTVIGGYAQLLELRLRDDPGGLVHVGEVRKASEKAAVLTRQLLTFSRRQPVDPVVIDPSGGLRDLEKILGRLLGPGIEIRFEHAPETPRVRIDRGHLDQVFMNLVVNARDALPSGGRILVRTGHAFLDEVFVHHHAGAHPGPHAVLEVTDDGIGMDTAVKARVFEPFFTTKGAGEGTGLGLATVYGIVRQAGGVIDLWSEPGKGTTFRVLLPAAGGDAGPAQGKGEAAGAYRGTGNLLVVEDEPAIRALVAAALRGRGFTVHEADRGDRALAAAEAVPGPLAAALLDVGLPGKAGPAVAAELRVRWPGLPVLYTTGSLDLVGLGDELAVPGTLHLQKPFTSEQLVAKVAELLG